MVICCGNCCCWSGRSAGLWGDQQRANRDWEMVHHDGLCGVIGRGQGVYFPFDQPNATDRFHFAPIGAMGAHPSCKGLS